jgi:hypothetical protein
MVLGSISYRTLGITGMCVNGLFLGVCVWRLVSTLLHTRAHVHKEGHKERASSRVRLHIAMFIFAFFEFVYQVSICATEKYVVMMGDVAVVCVCAMMCYDMLCCAMLC